MWWLLWGRVGLPEPSIDGHAGDECSPADPRGAAPHARYGLPPPPPVQRQQRAARSAPTPAVVLRSTYTTRNAGSTPLGQHLLGGSARREAGHEHLRRVGLRAEPVADEVVARLVGQTGPLPYSASARPRPCWRYVTSSASIPARARRWSRRSGHHLDRGVRVEPRLRREGGGVRLHPIRLVGVRRRVGASPAGTELECGRRSNAAVTLIDAAGRIAGWRGPPPRRRRAAPLRADCTACRLSRARIDGRTLYLPLRARAAVGARSGAMPRAVPSGRGRITTARCLEVAGGQTLLAAAARHGGVPGRRHRDERARRASAAS